jgi:predicted Zn-dependent protease
MMNSTVTRIASKIFVPFFIILSIVGYAGICSAAFTIEDEITLGKEFYEKLKKRDIFVDSPKVCNYINRLGQRLATQGQDQSPFDFTFTVIKDSGINAFATPGGYVYVFSGLIGITENESQLAGVLAHEIAHVKARHIAKTIEKSQKISIATLAAILAGAFLGGSAEATAAVTSFSMATASTLNLKYSREHEEEADRLGMSYLLHAGYDGQGMYDFLKIMRSYEFYSNSVPSYFLTHPGTSDRIAYLDGLLHVRNQEGGVQNIIKDYARIKTILYLDDKNPDTKINTLTSRLKENPDDIEALYGLAVMHSKTGQITESIELFNRALSLSPDDSDILRDLGITYFRTGETRKAIDTLRKAYMIDTNDSDTILYLGRCYEISGNYSAALNLYKEYQKGNVNNIDFYHKLAMMYGKLGNNVESHYNFGIFFKKKHKPESALFHFKAAMEHLSPDSEMAAKIRQEMESLKPSNQKRSKKPPPF